MLSSISRTVGALGRRLTYANVIATIALFAALGTSGAYAATKLSKNSVGAKQIKRNAVTSAKIKNGTITARDINRGTRSSLSKPGPAGPAGPQGPQGVQGPQGPPAATLYSTVHATGRKVTGTFPDSRSFDPGAYRLQAGRDITRCAATVTLAAVPVTPGGTPEAPPAGGSAAVELEKQSVVVRTYDGANNPADSGFHITIAC